MVTRAAAAAGIDRTSHNKWLKEDSPEGEAYRTAFDEAREIAGEKLEAEARRRAVEGIKKFKFHRGKPIIDPETGEPYFELEYSDTLLIFLMKGANPAKYRERYENTGDNGEPVLGPHMRLVEDSNWYGNAERLAEIEREQAQRSAVKNSS